LRQQREQRAQPRLHPRKRPHRLRAKADRPRGVLRGPQPDRPELRSGGGGGRRDPALLLPRRRPVLLRRHLLEVAMSMRAGGAAVALALLVGPAHGAELTLGPRLEYKHVSRGHEFHVSGAAVAARADGRPVVAWGAQEGHAHPLYLLLPDATTPPRVNPDGRGVEALHHPPRLAIAAGGGPMYVS